MSFKSSKQRGFLEEKFSKMNPKTNFQTTPKTQFTKDIQLPSLTSPNKFGRLKSIMKKGGF